MYAGWRMRPLILAIRESGFRIARMWSWFKRAHSSPVLHLTHGGRVRWRGISAARVHAITTQAWLIAGEVGRTHAPTTSARRPEGRAICRRMFALRHIGHAHRLGHVRALLVDRVRAAIDERIGPWERRRAGKPKASRRPGCHCHSQCLFQRVFHAERDLWQQHPVPQGVNDLPSPASHMLERITSDRERHSVKLAPP